MADEWSDDELRASVVAYQRMLADEEADRPFNKREIYRDLAARFSRTEKAFEYRMQNISSVLYEQGRSTVRGLKPASNVGTNVRIRLEQLLAQPESVLPANAESIRNPKIRALREWLIEVARVRGVVTYGEVADVFGGVAIGLGPVLSQLGHHSRGNGEPIITALVVNAQTRRCSEGLEQEFGITDDAAERQRLYERWHSQPRQPKPPTPAPSNLELRAIRFAIIEARPEQAAFRKRVFEAYQGRCAISGCDVDCALDAAHKKGRYWRQGHNQAADGYLLRKDLHALYDADLLEISNDGRLNFKVPASAHYVGLTSGHIADVS